MFTHDITLTKHYTTQSDGEQAFYGFCDLAGIDKENFPFKVNTGRMHKGKEKIFTITSWGSYINASDEYVIFVAYYSPAMKHTSQYSWSMSEHGKVEGIARKYEFIGG
jgi:hypothetical protein